MKTTRLRNTTKPQHCNAIAIGILAGFLAFGLGGCDRDEGPVEEAAEAVDESLDEAGDNVEDTAENIEDSVETAKDEVEEAAEEVEDEVKY